MTLLRVQCYTGCPLHAPQESHECDARADKCDHSGSGKTAKGVQGSREDHTEWYARWAGEYSEHRDPGTKINKCDHSGRETACEGDEGRYRR